MPLGCRDRPCGRRLRPPLISDSQSASSEGSVLPARALQDLGEPLSPGLPVRRAEGFDVAAGSFDVRRSIDLTESASCLPRSSRGRRERPVSRAPRRARRTSVSREQRVALLGSVAEGPTRTRRERAAHRSANRRSRSGPDVPQRRSGREADPGRLSRSRSRALVAPRVDLDDPVRVREESPRRPSSNRALVPTLSGRTTPCAFVGVRSNRERSSSSARRSSVSATQVLRTASRSGCTPVGRLGISAQDGVDRSPGVRRRRIDPRPSSRSSDVPSRTPERLERSSESGERATIRPGLCDLLVQPVLAESPRPSRDAVLSDFP